jgi:hypothetical protein
MGREMYGDGERELRRQVDKYCNARSADANESEAGAKCACCSLVNEEVKENIEPALSAEQDILWLHANVMSGSGTEV